LRDVIMKSYEKLKTEMEQLEQPMAEAKKQK
jgi:hypothetical protein